MKPLSKLFEEMMARKGIKAAQLAEKSGVKPATISNVINDKTGADETTLLAIAKALKLSESETHDLFLAAAIKRTSGEASKAWTAISEKVGPDDMNAVSVELPEDEAEIPIFAFLRGGGTNGSDFQGEVIGQLKVSKELARQGCQAVKIQGDSMEPKLFDGDVVIVKPVSGDFIDGRIYAILVEGWNQAVIKRIRRDPSGTVLLISENSKHPTREINPEVTTIQIIGQVVERRTFFKNGE